MKKAIIILSFFGSLILLNSFKSINYNLYIPYQEIDPKEESIERGKELYDEFCLQCHLDGKGTSEFPPLAGSDWLKNKRIESIKAVKYGLSGEVVVNGKTYNEVMPKQRMSADELADIMNYIMNSWGNSQKKLVTVEEVESITKL